MLQFDAKPKPEYKMSIFLNFEKIFTSIPLRVYSRVLKTKKLNPSKYISNQIGPKPKKGVGKKWKSVKGVWRVLGPISLEPVKL